MEANPWAVAVSLVGTGATVRLGCQPMARRVSACQTAAIGTFVGASSALGTKSLPRLVGYQIVPGSLPCRT